MGWFAPSTAAPLIPNPEPLIPNLARALLNAALAVLLAPRCAACGNGLSAPTLGPVCPECWRAVRPITPPVCEACGDPLPSWRAISLALDRCPRCRRSPGAIDRGRAIGEYDGALRAIIHALKYGGRRSVAARLGGLMREHGADLVAGADFAVPVPLHPRRRRARGFNQAEDLARHLALPVRHALVRVRPTPPQTDLPAAQRHRNVRDAFAVRPGGGRFDSRGLRGARVVLVDDVSTTGATLESCARVLKRAGVAEVRALTAARVATRRP